MAELNNGSRKSGSESERDGAPRNWHRVAGQVRLELEKIEPDYLLVEQWAKSALEVIGAGCSGEQLALVQAEPDTIVCLILDYAEALVYTHRQRAAAAVIKKALALASSSALPCAYDRQAWWYLHDVVSRAERLYVLMEMFDEAVAVGVSRSDAGRRICAGHQYKVKNNIAIMIEVAHCELKDLRRMHEAHLANSVELIDGVARVIATQ